MKYLTLLLFLTGCSNFQANIYIDPAFASYVKTFQDTYGQQVNVSMVFKPLTANALGETVGECVQNSSKIIYIDPEFWVTMGETGKEQVILHELGHCVLGILQHDFRTGQVGAYQNVPMSIMYPYIFGDESYYKENRAYYLKEL